MDTSDKPKEKPHYIGHRQRLRERFLSSGGQALADYEILEMLLFPARPQGDVKPLSKQLIDQFGGLFKVLTADAQRLSAEGGLSDASIAAIKIVQVAAERMLKAEITARPIIQSWTMLLDYCRMTMGNKTVEEFHVLFLNHKHMLIADEVQQKGTVNHTPVYPREVVRRALELGASAIILVHNHPSGDPSPSQSDIDITKQIIAAANPLDVSVHDHVIVGERGHYSFKSHGLI